MRLAGAGIICRKGMSMARVDLCNVFGFICVSIAFGTQLAFHNANYTGS